MSGFGEFERYGAGMGNGPLAPKAARDRYTTQNGGKGEEDTVNKKKSAGRRAKNRVLMRNSSGSINSSSGSGLNPALLKPVRRARPGAEGAGAARRRSGARAQRVEPARNGAPRRRRSRSNTSQETEAQQYLVGGEEGEEDAAGADGGPDENEPFYADDFEAESPNKAEPPPARSNQSMSPSQATIHGMHARLGLPKNLRYAVNLSKKALPVILFNTVDAELYRRFGPKAKKRSELVAMTNGTYNGDAANPALQATASPEAKSPKRASIRSHVPTCGCESCRRSRRNPSKLPTRLGFRTMGSEIKLIISTFQSHGLLSTRKWNVLWTSQHLKSYFYQGLERHQRVNQFPRSYEITRKDTLCRNINRMKALHGDRHYGYIPEGFVLPAESDAFERFYEQNGGGVFIVKPAALSCGRGINVTDDIRDIQLHGLDDNVQVSQYINDPLLVDGYKCDLRMYVGITNFNPLTIYVHEAGLARFATEKYSSSPDSFDNKFIHLTNFSINKMSDKFVVNEDEALDNVGQKWSLAAFKRRLVKDRGAEAVANAFDAVDDIFIKTFISIEAQVNSAMKMFVPYKENCFQLFGFDIMFDSALRPWLIEINFAPSLACGSPLDLNLKSSVVSDLLNLSGIQPYDEAKMGSGKADDKGGMGNGKGKRGGKKKKGKRPRPGAKGKCQQAAQPPPSRLEGYTVEEKRAILTVEAADRRAGGYTRIFPCKESYKYRSLFEEPRHLNDVLGDYFANGKRSPHKGLRNGNDDRGDRAFSYKY